MVYFKGSIVGPWPAVIQRAKVFQPPPDSSSSLSYLHFSSTHLAFLICHLDLDISSVSGQNVHLTDPIIPSPHLIVTSPHKILLLKTFLSLIFTCKLPPSPFHAGDCRSCYQTQPPPVSTSLYRLHLLLVPCYQHHRNHININISIPTPILPFCSCYFLSTTPSSLHSVFWKITFHVHDICVLFFDGAHVCVCVCECYSSKYKRKVFSCQRWQRLITIQ